MNTTRPIVLGILNAALPGLGYVWLPGRRLFGWLLLIGTFSAILARNIGFPAAELISPNKISADLELLSIMITAVAFGLDAYQQAKNSA